MLSDLLQLANNNIITVIITFIALSISLVKIIEILIKKLIPKSKTLSEEEYEKLQEIQENIIKLAKCIKKESILTEDEHQWLKNLNDLHNKYDKDGVPLWFYPRSLLDTQKEVTKILYGISLHQEKTTFILESILRELSRLNERNTNA